MTPRRVSIVIHSFDRGGSGKVAGYLARGFADRGLAVELLVIVPGGAVTDIVLPTLGDDVAVRYLGRATGIRALDLMLGIPALVRVLRSSAPDTVLAAANNAALATALAFRLAKVQGARLFLKTTNPVASSRHRGLVRAVRRAGYRAIFPWTSAVLTLSHAEADEMDAAFPAFAGRFHAVANPYVTPAMLTPLPAEKPGGRTIIAVARLTRQKRLERLITAFALVAEPARLLILGDGEDRATLAALITRLGLDGRVDMPGHVANVVPALHAADLFVLTSDYEGLPAVVLEAFAAGCPVLATPCFPSARALLAAPGCAVIEDVAPGALARQIEALLGQPRPSGLSRVAEAYSIESGIASHLHALGWCGSGTAVPS